MNFGRRFLFHSVKLISWLMVVVLFFVILPSKALAVTFIERLLETPESFETILRATNRTSTVSASLSLTYSRTNANKIRQISNSVTYYRRGDALFLNCRIQPLEKSTLTILEKIAYKPPTYVIYHGDRKVYSGKFEFG